MGRVLTLDDVRLEGRTALLRIDLNSPLHPETKMFLDDTRIKKAMPTLNRLTKSKVVLLVHQSRPGKDDFTSTLGHARELQRISGRPVQYVDDIHGDDALAAIDAMNDGDLLMLNNVRWDEEEMSRMDDSFEQLSDSRIVDRLSGVADVFINDAFACSHRNSPSITGFTHVLPCIAGELMQKEINAMQKVLHEPARPCIAVLGGIKVDDSVKVAKNILKDDIIDELWVTGGVGNLFLHYSGINIGNATVEFLHNELKDSWEDTIAIIEELLVEHKNKIVLPVDIAANIEGNRVDLDIHELPIEAPLFDLGIQSTLNLSSAIRNAGTVILNGPAGVFELPDFAFGTIEMIHACAESDGFVVIGGGHTATLINQRGLANKIGHISTGGGACLNFLAGEKLPAIEGLMASAEKFGVSILENIQDNQ